MGVRVNKSSPVMVKPREPMAKGGAIKLSFLDQIHVNIPVTSLIVFEHPIDKTPESIQRALSQALVHYYPISGRIPAGADEIQCTGEGVVFVAASADCSLEQSTLFKEEQPSPASPSGATSRALLDDLAVYYDPADGCVAKPLMLMQVTEFSCGGFVLGVTWNHAIGDTTGIAQFLQAVGEMARGMSSPSVLPSRIWDDSLIPSLSPSAVVALQQQSMANRKCEPPLDLAFLDVTIRSTLINRIKAEYDLVYCSHGQSSSSSCTTFEAVAAVLWRCRTRAIMLDPPSSSSSSPAVLSFAVNIRNHVGADDGYYGNGIAATGQKVISTIDAVINGNIADIVKAIKDAKDGISEMLKRIPISNPSSQQMVDRCSMLALSSWRNLGLDKPDFGSGSPTRVIFHAKPLASPQPFCMACLPWKGNDGASVMSLYIKKEHAHAFLAELASLDT
ncbi:hypothetical protein PR202_gb26183 [Eleusine coracana subsp. coracana]|uniref:Uncharacterized protein n=1 Tax=Eleusine coracana subsp. coracana TaxID=191504 RepID=A0AAV5FNB2_ELECO|nr:hypothetical protein PR202_gb26155 [Eleusine coracana subsp. coracana]GJN37251.1 hypothetical protein PR202_gb26183 [Eleusine coracana subsp. coracana]